MIYLNTVAFLFPTVDEQHINGKLETHVKVDETALRSQPCLEASFRRYECLMSANVCQLVPEFPVSVSARLVVSENLLTMYSTIQILSVIWSNVLL